MLRPTRWAWDLSAEAPASAPVRGRWFDGRSSQPQAVLVSLRPGKRGPGLSLHRLAEAGSPAIAIPAGQVAWPETWSAQRAPRTLVVDLGAHGSLEIDEVAQWQAAFAAAGARPSLAQRMQTRWPVLLAVLALSAALLWAFYRWGTPWAATQLTRQVPLDWETGLAQRALADMDKGWLKPSKLPAARQQELRARFDALAAQVGPGLRRYPGYAPPLSLSFRSGMGANAFALPGGSIVMTDGLVEAAAKAGLGDEALVGVLAHEIGHVMHRHTTRLVVEQAVLNVGLGLAVGDVSSLLSVGGAALTGLAYRRGHEAEADCFAIALLRGAGLPVAPTADLLLAMEGQRESQGAARKPGTLESLLSTHPHTHERALLLREGRAQGC